MTRMHTDLLSPVIIAGCSGRRVACEPIDLRPTRPPLQNSVPEFRRCEVTLTPLWFCHEEFKISYRSSCDRGRNNGTAISREWRTGPRHDCRGLGGWFSVSPLSALRPVRRADDSLSLHGHSSRSPVFGKRTDLCACKVLRALSCQG